MTGRLAEISLECYMDEMALIRLGKSYKGALCFEGKDNNLAFKVLAFRPVDEDGLTIPGVTVEIHLRVGLPPTDANTRSHYFI